ncbi:MAG: MarR family transcriptional regulator [Anaerolineae bacterium]|nr:MarR family transcriptional regulator [Anaerolineae bacterium]
MIAQQQYRLLHDIYVLLDDGDHRVLSAYDLTPSQYAVLLLLDAHEGIRLTTVSDRLLLARSTITRIVDQLEKTGLVRRESDPDDRRAQRVILTAEGEARRAAAQTAHDQSIELRMRALKPADHKQLYGLLTKLRQSLRDHLDSETF